MPRGGVGGAALSVLLAGSVSSVLAKVMYQMQVRAPPKSHSVLCMQLCRGAACSRCCSPAALPPALQAPGCAGEVKHFEKPWASTLLMFLAMALCLPAAVAAPHLQAWLRRLDAAAGGGASEDGLREPLLRQGGSIGSASTASSLTPGRLTPAAAGSSARGTALPGRRALLVVLVPTAFDLLATLLLAAALLTITASSFMMLRGSEVLWAALLATTWLRRPLNRWHLAGIAICSVRGGRMGSRHAATRRGDAAVMLPGPAIHRIRRA